MSAPRRQSLYDALLGAKQNLLSASWGQAESPAPERARRASMIPALSPSKEAPSGGSSGAVFTAFGTSSLSAKEIKRKVQESDDRFFETFSGLYWNLEATKKELIDAGRKASRIDGKDNTMSIKFNQIARLSDKELESLYHEVLYTVRHKVGATPGGKKAIQAAEFLRYARDAFEVTPEDHERLSTKAQQDKPPVVVLNVVVIEAQGLIAKDANGKSDPYCMLGIVPGKRSAKGASGLGSPSSDSGDKSPSHEKRKSTGGFASRIGASFHRKSHHHKGKKAAEISPEEIPAKFIKATSIQRETLCPQYNEKFLFNIEDGATDVFHLDIWDHDDDASVVDAVRGLNNVSGMKGLSRYFKQVAQSARSSNDESVDDFLGSIDHDIANIPDTGLEIWLDLQPRSEKSEVSGRIKLKMWLGTREEREDQDEDDNEADIKEHTQLIRIFAEHTLRHYKKDAWKWSGELPGEALGILHQHAIQGDITAVQEAMCYWLAYSGIHLDLQLDYRLLHRVLADLLSTWLPTTLDKEEEDMLAEAFSSFLAQCYDCVLRHRDVLPSGDPNSAHRLEDLLRCLTLLHSSDLFRKCLPFQRALSSELQALLKKSAIGHYERAKYTHADSKRRNSTGGEELGRLSQIFTVVNAACAQGKKLYHRIFKTITNIDYFTITYREFDRLSSDLFAAAMLDQSVGVDLHSDVHRITQEALVPVFTLYLSLSEFFAYRSQVAETERAKLRSWDTARWFEAAINRWLHLAKERAFARVDLSCVLDKKIEAHKTEIQQSTSYVDVCYTLHQMLEFWERIETGDPSKNCDLTEQLVSCICKVAEYFADKTAGALANSNFYADPPPGPVDENTIQTLCVTVNNMEQVRRVLKDLPDKLHFDDLAYQLDLKGAAAEGKGRGSWRVRVESGIEAVDASISAGIDAALGRLVKRRGDALKKHLFHLAWSPSGCEAERAAAPLLEELDGWLMEYHRWLLHRNFVRLLSAQLAALVAQFQGLVDENPGSEPDFYRRLFDAMTILVDFFHANGKGVSMEAVAGMVPHRELIDLLRMNQNSTRELIRQYYRGLLKEQEELTDFKYGILNLRAYYNLHSRTLVVDVMGAKNIIPLDNNGLSDPFVVIELVPPSAFPAAPILKTKVVYKTLNPVYDETFEFELPSKFGDLGLLHLTVMDHDFLVSNDFAGEAYLDLKDVPGFGGAHSTLRQFNLVLMHPPPKPLSPLTVMESRKEDVEAQEFMKRRLNVLNA